MQRVQRADIHRVTIPYRKAVTWEGGREEAADYVVLRLFADDGTEGAAECTAKPTWNGCDAATLATALERLVLPMLRGRDLAQPGALAEPLRRLVENAAAKALLENAQADLLGLASDRPVPVSWTLTRDTPERMALEAEAVVKRHGFTVLKVKGGQGAAVDSAVIRAVRHAVGESVSFYVDTNGAHPADDALAYAAALEDAGAIAVEDPYNLKPDNHLTAVQAGLRVPVIVDFSLDGVSSARTFLQRGARGLSLKPTRFGLRKTSEMADAAARAGALVVVGLFGESQAGAVHLMEMHSRLPPALPAEATFHLTLLDHYLHQPLEIRDGRLVRPEARNLAALIDWPRLERLGGGPVASVRF